MKSKIFRYLAALTCLLQFIFSFWPAPFVTELTIFEWADAIQKVQALENSVGISDLSNILFSTPAYFIVWAMIVLPCVCMIFWLIPFISERVVIVIQIISNFVVWTVSVAVFVISDTFLDIMQDLQEKEIIKLSAPLTNSDILGYNFYIGILLTILVLIFFSLNRYFSASEGETMRPIPFSDELPLFDSELNLDQNNEVSVVRKNNEYVNQENMQIKQNSPNSPIKAQNQLDFNQVSEKFQTDSTAVEEVKIPPNLQSQQAFMQGFEHVTKQIDLQESENTPQPKSSSLLDSIPVYEDSKLQHHDMEINQSFPSEQLSLHMSYDEIPPFSELTPREGEYLFEPEYHAPVEHDISQKQVQSDDKNACITCVSGIYSGSEFPIEAGESIVIGRDASVCHIVFPEENREISRQHCQVTLLPDASGYEIITTATYGLQIDKYLSKSGEKLKIKRGSVLSLDDNQNVFILQ